MKTIHKFFVIAACVMSLGGCSGSRPEPALKPDFERGGRIFGVFCQQCHLNPEHEAPQLDEADDWDMRSHQWTAVLRDHAKKGFLDMPAKGGHPGLTDQNINDALYFMEIKIRALQ